MPDATSRQKQFLRALGHKDVGKLTKEQASKLIDELLAAEKASGKTFHCPYCKSRFGPRPKRQAKCPKCGKTIIQLSGKFYTEDQADAKFQNDWLKDSRQDVKSEVVEECGMRSNSAKSSASHLPLAISSKRVHPALMRSIGKDC
jgi:ribosomal protein L37AE/L43A